MYLDKLSMFCQILNIADKTKGFFTSFFFFLLLLLFIFLTSRTNEKTIKKPTK